MKHAGQTLRAGQSTHTRNVGQNDQHPVDHGESNAWNRMKGRIKKQKNNNNNTTGWTQDYTFDWISAARR